MADHDETTVIYPAREVVTVNPMQPTAEVVAVRDGRIRAVGDRESVVAGIEATGDTFRIDGQFSDLVILPGLIEAHSHVTVTGTFYQMPVYLGAYDRPGPHGRLEGCASRDAAIERLREAAAATTEGPIQAWGYDPAQFEGRPQLDRTMLDAVSADRPVMVIDMSGHGVTVNSVVLERAGYDADSTMEGVFKGPDGEPTGQIAELPAMAPALIPYFDLSPGHLASGIAMTAALAQQRGLTTISDLLTNSPNEIEAMSAYARSADANCRIASYYSAMSLDLMADEAMPFLLDAIADNDDWFRLAGVKLVTDGSIQLFTALLRNPPYYNGHENGWLTVERKGLVDRMAALHNEGIQLAVHTNGDGATDEMLDAIDELLARHPRPGHRHRFEHVQLLTPNQIDRMARLGIAVNVFSKHIFYWGDFHRSVSLGPDRAAQMDPCASVARGGVRFAIHSDAWVTPIDQLEAMWTAMARQTRSGFVLGAQERIGLDQALRAVTIDAAYLLGEDRDKGSIEGGKLADLTVIDRPLDAQDPESVRLANPVATVLGGRVIACEPT